MSHLSVSESGEPEGSEEEPDIDDQPVRSTAMLQLPSENATPANSKRVSELEQELRAQKEAYQRLQAELEQAKKGPQEPSAAPPAAAGVPGKPKNWGKFGGKFRAAANQVLLENMKKEQERKGVMDIAQVAKMAVAQKEARKVKLCIRRQVDSQKLQKVRSTVAMVKKASFHSSSLEAHSVSEDDSDSKTEKSVTAAGVPIIKIHNRREEVKQELMQMAIDDVQKRIERAAAAEDHMIQGRRRPNRRQSISIMIANKDDDDDVEVVDLGNGAPFGVDFSALEDLAEDPVEPINWGLVWVRSLLIGFLLLQAVTAVISLYTYYSPTTWEGHMVGRLKDELDEPTQATNGLELRERCLWVGRFYFFFMYSLLVGTAFFCETAVLSKLGGLDLLSWLPEKAKAVQKRAEEHWLMRMVSMSVVFYSLCNMFATVTYQGFYLLVGSDQTCWPFIEGTPWVRRSIYMQLVCGAIRTFTVILMAIRQIVRDWNQASEIENKAEEA